MPATSLVLIIIWNDAEMVFLAHMCGLECVQVAVSSVSHICAGDAQYTPCKLAKDTLVLVFVLIFVFVAVSSCEGDEMLRRSLHPFLGIHLDLPSKFHSQLHLLFVIAHVH